MTLKTLLFTLILFAFTFTAPPNVSCDTCRLIMGPEWSCPTKEPEGAGSSAVAYMLAGSGLVKKALVKVQDVTDPGKKSRAEQELKILRACNHDNIIRLYKDVYSNNLQYTLIEYGEHGSLADFFDEENAKGKDSMFAEPYFVLEIVRGLAAGLDYLHSKNFVHADLKLGNSVLSADYTPKLIDFDLSVTYNTKDGKRGSPSYMAPEVLRGSMNIMYSYYTDVWSLGVMLYEMSHGGSMPFTSFSQDGLMLLQKAGNFVLPAGTDIMVAFLLSNMLVEPADKRITPKAIMDHIDNYLAKFEGKTVVEHKLSIYQPKKMDEFILTGQAPVQKKVEPVVQPQQYPMPESKKFNQPVPVTNFYQKNANKGVPGIPTNGPIKGVDLGAKRNDQPVQQNLGPNKFQDPTEDFARMDALLVQANRQIEYTDQVLARQKELYPEAKIPPSKDILTTEEFAKQLLKKHEQPGYMTPGHQQQPGNVPSYTPKNYGQPTDNGNQGQVKRKDSLDGKLHFNYRDPNGYNAQKDIDKLYQGVTPLRGNRPSSQANGGDFTTAYNRANVNDMNRMNQDQLDNLMNYPKPTQKVPFDPNLLPPTYQKGYTLDQYQDYKANNPQERIAYIPSQKYNQVPDYRTPEQIQRDEVERVIKKYQYLQQRVLAKSETEEEIGMYGKPIVTEERSEFLAWCGLVLLAFAVAVPVAAFWVDKIRKAVLKSAGIVDATPQKAAPEVLVVATTLRPDSN